MFCKEMGPSYKCIRFPPQWTSEGLIDFPSVLTIDVCGEWKQEIK